MVKQLLKYNFHEVQIPTGEYCIQGPLDHSVDYDYDSVIK